VNRFVFLSVAGATTNKWVPHHAVEQELRRGPRDWTILQPGFFAQNLESAYRDDIVQDGRLYVPAGSGKVAFVDVRNIGAVAARVLTTESGHEGMTYTLTGPEAFTFYQVADQLSRHLGRNICYQPATIPGYLYHLAVRRRLPVMQAVVQAVLHTGLRFGQAEAVTPTLGRLLNKTPNTVVDYIRDQKDVWQ
jgi:uncharacterized protein YbjT (DUF2867 family)